MSASAVEKILNLLREVTRGSEYQGRLFVVGGMVRDKVLGLPHEEDVDIVLEGDAGALAEFIAAKAQADHPPVTYPRFGTAMVGVGGVRVELVGARRESYDISSRKPFTTAGTLMDDVLRRDFTINTLLENLHTGEILDLTGAAFRDLRAGVIRTPLDPIATFKDDPLRMLRAIRFAVRLDFSIEPDTFAAISECAPRLGIISAERIRDEFVKIMDCAGAVVGLEMLRRTRLLAEFAPELDAMHGVTQNIYHLYDVWQHTLKTLESIPQEAGITVRLAALLHDVGKPITRTEDENGNVHFYHHQSVGAEIAREFMRGLRFSNSETEEVAFLVSMHLRVGEYDEQWTDSAVRRLVRDAGSRLEDMFLLTSADKAAANPEMPSADLDALKAHIVRANKDLQGKRIVSPLDGREIMNLLNLPAGRDIGTIKRYLENEIIEGNLAPGDKDTAADILLCKYGRKSER